MKIEENEILLIYNSNDIQDRQALAYAKSLDGYKVKEYDVINHQFTSLHLEEIIQMLQINPSEIINKNSDEYQNKYLDSKLERADVLKALENNPSLIKTPIAIYNDKARFVGNSFEFIKKDMKQRKSDSSQV